MNAGNDGRLKSTSPPKPKQRQEEVRVYQCFLCAQQGQEQLTSQLVTIRDEDGKKVKGRYMCSAHAMVHGLMAATPAFKQMMEKMVEELQNESKTKPEAGRV